jgi:hypothetical protein
VIECESQGVPSAEWRENKTHEFVEQRVLFAFKYTTPPGYPPWSTRMADNVRNDVIPFHCLGAEKQDHVLEHKRAKLKCKRSKRLAVSLLDVSLRA